MNNMRNEYQTLLLEFSVNNIKEYDKGKLSFSFMPAQRVYDYVDSDSSVSRISDSTLYDNKITAISGINASGKTTLLDWLAFILRLYFCNDSLLLQDHKELLDRFYDNQAICINLLYKSNGKTYSAESYIERKMEDFRFTEEIVTEYVGSVITRRSLYSSDKYKEVMRRSLLNEEQKSFLEDGKSIVFSTISKEDISRVYICDEEVHEDFGNRVVLASLIGLPYFDSSIEYVFPKGKGLFTIKRKGKSAEEVTQAKLLSMLSSGTFRGINFMGKLLNMLKYGGYILLDEIEEHFNKTIVMNIIELFMKKATNPNDAHLIFTTHYQELLDILPRNDSVYITTRNDELNLVVKNLAEFLKRNDMKKSDILFSGYYDLGTAVDYESYLSLLQNVEGFVSSKEYS